MGSVQEKYDSKPDNIGRFMFGGYILGAVLLLSASYTGRYFENHSENCPAIRTSTVLGATGVAIVAGSLSTGLFLTVRQRRLEDLEIEEKERRRLEEL